MSWTLDAHAGHGQLHIRPFLDLADPRDLAKLEPLATRRLRRRARPRRDDLRRARLRPGPDPVPPPPVRRPRSTPSARSRTPSTRYNLLNPGKVVGDDPHLMTRHLKPVARPAPPVAEPTPPTADRAAADARARSLAVDRPRAPLARPDGPGAGRRPATAAGPAGPRSRASGCARPSGPSGPRPPRPGTRPTCSARSPPGPIDPKLWGSEEFKANADLCIHCTSAGRSAPPASTSRA